MKRYSSIKWKRDKIVRGLTKERKRLFEATWNLGFVPLEKPLKHGWFKHLALRDDVARRKDAHVLQEVIEASGLEAWGRDKEHADKIWNRENRKGLSIQFPGIQKLNQKEYNKLSVQAKKWYEGFDWYWCPVGGHQKRYYCRVPRYFFKLAYTRAYVTKLQAVDPELEQRIDEVEAKMRTPELYHLTYNRYRYKVFRYHKKVRRKVKQSLRCYDEERFDRQVFVEPWYW